jgi:hypothetical protein
MRVFVGRPGATVGEPDGNVADPCGTVAVVGCVAVGVPTAAVLVAVNTHVDDGRGVGVTLTAVGTRTVGGMTDVAVGGNSSDGTSGGGTAPGALGTGPVASPGALSASRVFSPEEKNGVHGQLEPSSQ